MQRFKLGLVLNVDRVIRNTSLTFQGQGYIT